MNHAMRTCRSLRQTLQTEPVPTVILGMLVCMGSLLGAIGLGYVFTTYPSGSITYFTWGISYEGVYYSWSITTKEVFAGMAGLSAAAACVAVLHETERDILRKVAFIVYGGYGALMALGGLIALPFELVYHDMDQHWYALEYFYWSYWFSQVVLKPVALYAAPVFVGAMVGWAFYLVFRLFTWMVDQFTP